MTTRAIDVRIARGTISSDFRSRYKEQYKNIRSIELDYGDYPFSAPGSTAAVEDLRYWQHELGLQGLFATETVCSVFELRDGSGDIFSGIGDRDLQQMVTLIICKIGIHADRVRYGHPKESNYAPCTLPSALISCNFC